MGVTLLSTARPMNDQTFLIYDSFHNSLAAAATFRPGPLAIACSDIFLCFGSFMNFALGVLKQHYVKWN